MGPAVPSLEYLRQLMRDNYQVQNLIGIDPTEFRRRIEEFEALDDYAMEGFQSSEAQRGKSVRFQWAADHDFGTFQVKGMAAERPLWLLAVFMDVMPVLQRRLDGLRVLDVGCWTGGTSLALAAMGANVVAIEEVKKYVDCLTYLRDSFGVENLEPRNLSLFDLTGDEFQDAFDVVLFAGVLYHLSDPVLGTRITFNTLKPGGSCLMETAVCRSEKRICEYAGHDVIRGGGANWFIPAPQVAADMMREVGYEDVRTSLLRGRRQDRLVAVGSKKTQVDMLRAGLSVRNIR